MVKIDVQRTGFPVTIGTLELWFDSSLENLKSFFNIEEVAQKRIKKAQKKTEHLHFPNGFTSTNELDDKTIDAAFDVNKEYIAIQYDIIFGNGTFKKIYKEYPDIIALENALDPISFEIAKKIEEQENERSEQIEAKKQEYLNKKQKKR